MIRRFVTCLTAASTILIAAAASPAWAQDTDCRFFKVGDATVNMFDQPRSLSKFVAALSKNDVLCVAGDQYVDDKVWAYVAYQVVGGDQRKAIEGWLVKSALQPASQTEVAAARAAPSPPVQPAPPAQAAPSPPSAPTAQAAVPIQAPPPSPPPVQQPPSDQGTPPATDVVRFSQPITFGPPPVNGLSLQQLIAGMPIFPPIEGLPENVWKKPCASCHQWTQQTLCTQASTYLKDPKMALRVPHPYGGPEKTAMIKWAEGGCQ